MRNLHVLVAEDDVALLQLAAMILEQDGYAVLKASDGAQALETSRVADRVDIVLTDVVMPNLDGFDLGRALAVERVGIRAVFTTALMGEVAKASAREFGCELLPKPYTPAELRRAVAEARPLQDPTEGGDR
ncbi:MAG: hybrid sensor histidine kinase/response regulator [Ilumatobacteraceae bacterium]|nr:hybrid sensor histidine kinase/response regulator [Ilumatobacteraceae bacterium]